MGAYITTQSGRFSVGSTWVGGVAPSADGDTWTKANGHTLDYDFDNSGHANGWGNCTITGTGTLRAYEQLAISNDANGTIASLAGITGLTPLFQESTGSPATCTYKIYPSVVDDGGGAWHIDLYKEVGRATKIAHTGNITADGSYALTADSSSGVGGTLTVANFATIAADVDIIASGYFYCKMNGAISGSSSGRVDVGSSGTAYPKHLFIRFEETKTTGDLFTCTNLTNYLYCDEPTIYRTTLSGVEAAGQTVLSVANDLTADAAHWIPGAMVRIDDLGAAESEERVIASISATELTITAGLTAAKQVGAVVTLVSRNISLLGPSATQCNAINGGTGGVHRASVRRWNNGVNGGTGHTNSGTFTGNTNGVYSGTGHVNSGTFAGNTNGVSGGSHIITRSAVFSGNTQDIVMPAVVYGYGMRLQSATPVSGYTTLSGLQSQNVTMLYDYADSSDVPQVGRYKCWMQSGVIVTAAATEGGPTLSHAHTFANIQDQLRLDIPLRLTAGHTYTWSIQVKSAQAPSGMTLRPTFSICDPHRLPYDPAEALATVAVPNDTNTAWQTVILAYTPTQTREYTLRGSAQNATGSFEWWASEPPVYPPPMVTI